MTEKTLKDGSLYRVDDVLALQAVVLQGRLLKLVGGAIKDIPAIMAGHGEKATDDEKRASDAAAISALGNIVAGADPVEVGKLIAEIVAYGSIKPHGATGWHKADLDAHFTDRKSDLYPVVIFTLREIFGDFFTGSLASGLLKRAKMVVT